MQYSQMKVWLAIPIGNINGRGQDTDMVISFVPSIISLFRRKDASLYNYMGDKNRNEERGHAWQHAPACAPFIKSPDVDRRGHHVVGKEC